MTASAKPLPHTVTRPACSATTARSSPAAPAAPAGSCWRSPSTPAESASGTPGPTTRRPAARSNASTRPSKSGSAQPRAQTLPRLQTQLDTFRSYYNTARPHRALGRRTPQQAYLARPKAVPTGTPLDDSHYRIRHDRIDSCGKLTLRHNSRLHHLGIGRRHAGTNVLILVHDLHIRVLTTDGELLQELQLDPTKDYQPQTKT
ncbi:MAG: integrase core domain-containing protein [Mycobacteriales bacterium]